MPSATRAEALVGIPEVIDGPNPIEISKTPMADSGAAVNQRLSVISRFPPLGPPDMLYTRKRYTPVVGTSKLYGYYHFVRGVDPSSVAKISAYIVDVVRNNGLDPLPWVSAGGWEVASATFFVYNIISKADISVHVDFPGGTVVTARDANNHPVPLNDTLWQEIHVSSVVRNLLSHGEDPIYPCLRVISDARWMLRSEPLFLEASINCVHRWHLAGVDAADPATDSAAYSRIGIVIRDHFLTHSRYEPAISFFLNERLRQVDERCVLHAAAAARAKGDLDYASQLVDEVMQSRRELDVAWIEKAKILRATGDIPKALEAAKTATSFTDNNMEAWILLADLYVDLKEYEKAFESLNSADMSPPSLDPFLRKLVPRRKNTTAPVDGSSRGSDAIRVFAQKLREEKLASTEKTEDYLKELPSKLMTPAEHKCYAILVKMWKDLSWDEMLAVRGQCFVMETDIDSEERAEISDASQESGDDEHSSGSEEDVNGVSRIPLSDNGEEEEAEQAQRTSSRSEDVTERKRRLEKIGKKICKPWLDYLVTNMYHDLHAMASWNSEEQQHSAAGALAAAAIARKSQSLVENREAVSSDELADVEAQEPVESFRRTADEVASTSQRPAEDWLRRGELALRLDNIEEARTAFWVCVKLSEKQKRVNLTALTRLMSLAGKSGNIRETLQTADAIWTFMDNNTDRKSTSESTRPVRDIRISIFRLISQRGLRAVRDEMTELNSIDTNRMEGLLLDAVDMKVSGFSH